LEEALSADMEALAAAAVEALVATATGGGGRGVDAGRAAADLEEAVAADVEAAVEALVAAGRGALLGREENESRAQIFFDLGFHAVYIPGTKKPSNLSHRMRRRGCLKCRSHTQMAQLS
jgi:hypothetical protein